MNQAVHAFVENLATLIQRSPLDQSGTINTRKFSSVWLDRQLKNEVGLEIYGYNTALEGHYGTAVNLSRRGDLAAALKKLHAADNLMTDLPAIAREYVCLTQLTSWAYYFHKAGDLEQAVEALKKCLSVSADLESRGYPSLIYFRIEVLQKIATIYSHHQQDVAAHNLQKSTLTYVHSGKARGLFIEEWDACAIQRIRIFQEYLLDAVFIGLANQNTATMNHPLYNNEYYYRFFFQDLLDEMQTDTYNRVVLYNWMYVKSSYFTSGPAVFLDNTMHFITDSAIGTEYDVLKKNLLAQASWYIGQLPSSHQHLAEAIQEFATKM